MRRILLVLIVLASIGCNKASFPESDLTGTWKLVSYCKPTGVATCDAVNVPANKGVFISFMRDSKYNETYQNTLPKEYSFLGCGGGSYELKREHIRIRAMCMSSSNGQLIKLVSLTSRRLVLNPFDTGEYIFEKE